MRRSVLVALLVGVAGCATTSPYVSTNRSPRPLSPRGVDEVEVFTAGLPSRGFVEVGVFTQIGSYVGFGDVVVLFRRQAAEVGCDGIVVREPRSVTFDHAGVPPDHGTEFTAVCIVYE